MSQSTLPPSSSPDGDTVARVRIEHAAKACLRVGLGGEWLLEPPQNAPDKGKLALRQGTLEAQGLGGVLEALLPPVLEALKRPGLNALVFEDDGLGNWDSTLMVFTSRVVSTARQLNIAVDMATLPSGLAHLTELALAVPPNLEAKNQKLDPGIFERLGGFVLSVPTTVVSILDFIGEMVLSFGRLMRGRSACRGRDVLLAIQECGIGALPIVSLISLLVGLILAFVGVVQLRMFRAEIYISSLVAIGMTRIMGAIMTGIILSGRTGASYAAVIGTMQVNEEIDALVTLGVPPSDYLVTPRLIALSIMTPLLVLYADFMGMVGGFLVGVLLIDLDPIEYMTFTQKGFSLNNLWVGLVHSFAFGVLIAMIGCYQGLRCGRSAEAVGKATTAAVVYSIVGIVLATAVLTLLFNIIHV